MKNLDFEEMKIVKLSKKIKHQGIGGKEFRIEKVGKMSYILDMKFQDMTFAARNFILRREDIFQISDDTTIYYGHCLYNNYGYFIAEDEIECEVNDTKSIYRKGTYQYQKDITIKIILQIMIILCGILSGIFIHIILK